MLSNKDIILCSNTFDFIFNYKLGLVNKLKESFNTITISAPSKNIKFNNFINAENIHLKSIGFTRKGLLCLLNFFFYFSKQLILKKNQIIISHTAYCNILLLISYYFFGKINNNFIFIFVSGFGPSRIRNSLRIRFIGRLYLFVLRYFSKVKNVNIVTLNHFDKNLIKDFDSKRNVYLYREAGLNINDTRIRYIQKEFNQNKLNIGFLGRFLIEKGIEDIKELVDFNKSFFSENNFFFKFGGTNDIENSSNIELNNIFKNFQNISIENKPDYNNFFNKIDILLFPSYREGHPHFILKAMNFGVVPIVYNFPGNTVDIIDEFNGFITKENSPNGILSILLKLNKNRELMKFISTNARRYAQKNFEKDSVDNLYNLIISRIKNY